VLKTRRKTLVNAIGNYGALPFEKPDIAKALKSLDLPEDIRGEKLSLTQFAMLSNALT